MSDKPGGVAAPDTAPGSPSGEWSDEQHHVAPEGAQRQCWKVDDEPWCCCNCRHLAVDLSHPLTDGGRLTEQRGWVCLAPDFDHDGRKAVISGHAEHGMCEMWDDRP